MASVDVGLGLDLANPRTWWQVGKTVAVNAVWADNPVVQIATNILIIVAAMLSSAVGFAPGIVIAFMAMFFIGVAVLRLIVRFFTR